MNSRRIVHVVCLVAAALAPALAAAQERNVLLVTLDGIRREEFLGRSNDALSPDDQEPLLPFFLGKLAPKGQIYGDPRQQNVMTIANTYAVSLPAYQSIIAGVTQPCANNDCGRIEAETLAERLARELNAGPYAVATIASWGKIALAAEKNAGSTFVNAAVTALSDDAPDSELSALNEAQAANPPPWGGARFDRYTFAQSMRYLRRHQPRFLFMSFNDADEWGHRADYSEYKSSLRRYDAWLKETVAVLASLGDYGTASFVAGRSCVDCISVRCLTRADGTRLMWSRLLSRVFAEFLRS